MKTSALIILPLSLLVAACGGNADSSNAANETGSFSLSLTDAPVDTAYQVVVRFDSVSIKPVDGEAIEFAFETPKDIDLLQLTGNVSEKLLDEVSLPVGDYEWIRLGVLAEHDGELDSFIELSDGSQKELRVPSGSETGLKLNHGFTVSANSNTNFTIDFDLRKSITNPPGLDGALLKPTLRLVDNLEVGSIMGTVSADLLGAECEDVTLNDGAVYVFSGHDIMPTDFQGEETDAVVTASVMYADDAYRYEAGFLEAGPYTVAYTCGNAEDELESVETLIFVNATNVTVAAGEAVELNFSN